MTKSEIINKGKKINTGDSAVDRLYAAVINYVEKRGGAAVVVGGICLVEESRSKFDYGVMVRIAGKKPTFPPFPPPKKLIKGT